MWDYLVKHASDFGFLGPIVGIVGLLLGASGAIFFGFTRKLDTWKPPPDIFPKGLERIVGMLCAVGLFVIWLLAEPKNGSVFLHVAIGLAVGGFVAFLAYISLWAYCGRCRKPLIGSDNVPTREVVVWGGFWLWPEVRKEVRSDNPVCTILKGKQYESSQVWPEPSLALSAVVTAAVLIVMLVCGTLALATAGASIQVALTGKPARSVFSTSEVPGLSPSTPPLAAETLRPGDAKK